MKLTLFFISIFILLQTFLNFSFNTRISEIQENQETIIYLINQRQYIGGSAYVNGNGTAIGEDAN